MFLTEQKVLWHQMQEQFRSISSSTKLLILKFFEVRQNLGEICEEFLTVLCNDAASCLD